LILVVSSIPNLTTPGFSGSDKLAHFCEYAALGVLTRRAAGNGGWKGWVIAIAIALAIGAADELYQSRVPGRVSSRYDWFADGLGGIAGATAWMVLSKARSVFGARKGAPRGDE
jgi:VanZ family protein